MRLLIDWRIDVEKNAVLYNPAALRGFIVDVFKSKDVSAEHSGQVADVLLFANLRGIDTHGVIRTGLYLDRFKSNLVNPKPIFSFTQSFPWAVAIDGDNAMGAVAGNHAMSEVINRAQTFGIGGATVRRSNHFGAASYYALRAVEVGCIGIVLSPASKALAPYGSMEPLFGTNPIAVGIPSGRAPWVLDMVTSIVARGHIRLAARRGELIPEGWALDSYGETTTDAAAALKGVMLPFAGAKGSALAMLVDIMGGVLSGSGFAGTIRDMTLDFSEPQDVGHFFLAIKIEAFMPPETFFERMKESILRLKALQPAAGFEEVCYPGEREARVAIERSVKGIPIPTESFKVLQAASEATGVSLPSPL